MILVETVSLIPGGSACITTCQILRSGDEVATQSAMTDIPMLPLLISHVCSMATLSTKEVLRSFTLSECMPVCIIITIIIIILTAFAAVAENKNLRMVRVK